MSSTIQHWRNKTNKNWFKGKKNWNAFIINVWYIFICLSLCGWSACFKILMLRNWWATYFLFLIIWNLKNARSKKNCISGILMGIFKKIVSSFTFLSRHKYHTCCFVSKYTLGMELNFLNDCQNVFEKYFFTNHFNFSDV